MLSALATREEPSLYKLGTVVFSWNFGATDEWNIYK